MKKILIIDDEPPYIRIIRDQLISQGHNVLEARDGSSGLEIAMKEKPDLILLDIRMPVIDGMTVLKRLRENKWGKDANVIVLTNANDSINISNAMNAKVSKYIVKSDTSFSAVMGDIQILLQKQL